VKIGGSKQIFLGQLLASLFSLIAVAITAKYVGPEIFAFCSIAVTIQILYMSLVDFGACSWAARELASNNISDKIFIDVMNAKARLNMLPTFISPLIYNLLPEKYSWVALLCFYPLLWNYYNFIQQFLIVKGHFDKSIRLVIIERFCWFMIVPLQSLDADLSFSFVFPIISGLLVHGVIGRTYLKKIGDISDSKVVMRNIEIFRESRHFGFISFYAVFSRFDGMVVAYFTDLSNSGSYIMAHRFRTPLTLIFQSFSTRIKPIAAKKDPKLIKDAFSTDISFIVFGIVGNVFFSILLFLGSDQFLGSSFENVGLIVFIGTLTSIPLGITLVASSILSAMHFEKLMALIHGYYAFFLIGGVSIFAYFHGALGAVFWVFTQALVVSVLLSRKLFRELKLQSA
jgi:O-antigen/teichoic acid export membrane protein